MNQEDRDYVSRLYAKAEDTLHAAEYDLTGGFLLATTNRAYYAAYYCIVALLHTKDVSTKTHQGAHTKFAELFIKTSLFPKYASDIINKLFEDRQEADYDLDADITAEEARELIAKASAFLQLTKEYFAKLKLQ